MKSNFFRIFLISIACFLSACSEKVLESQQSQSQMRIQVNENMGMVGVAFVSVFSADDNPKYAKNLSKAISKMDFTPDDENFADFINSLKDIDSSEQPADFKVGFKEDLKGFHKFWNSSLRTLENKQRGLQRFCDRFVTSDYLAKIRTLFKSKLSNKELNVYLIPSLHEHSAMSSYIGDQIFLQLMPGSTIDHVGVILHEFFHINYAKSTIQMEMEKVFKENKAEFIQNFMNEALAVAGGNILSALQFANKVEKEGFSCEYINRFGIALAPLVKSYMDEGKSLDRNFFEQSIKIFKEEFSDYERNLKYRLMDIKIFSSEQDDKKLQDRVMNLMKTFGDEIWFANIQSYGLNSNLISPESANIVLLKNGENCKDFKVKPNEVVVHHAKNSVLMIIIKSGDPNALPNVIKRLLKMDISTDFKMAMNA